MHNENTSAVGKCVAVAGCAFVMLVASAASAATPLDEDAWPQVTPQYLDGGRKRAPRPPAQKDAQKSVRRFDRKVSARVEMVNGSPEFDADALREKLNNLDIGRLL